MSRYPHRPAMSAHLRASAERHLSKKKWAQPEADWVPLKQAVFRFGVTEDSNSTNFPDKPFHELTEAEIAESSGSPSALGELTKMLKERTGAYEAKIDLDKCTFSFSFHSAGGGASCMGGPPWTILQELGDAAVNIDPRLNANALFNKEGVRIREDKSARYAKENDAVREATGLVWRQFVLRAFNRVVSTGAVLLYARVGAVSARFERLPVDVWPILDVVDWENGVAIAPDHTAYWSIYAECVTTSAAECESGLKEAPRKIIHEAIRLRMHFSGQFA
jgi:hypothetical protein